MGPVAGDGLASALVRPVAVGEFVRVDRFAHAGAHRDPAEEHVPRPTIVFTRRGAWTLGSAAGGGRLDAARVALLEPARPYRCWHDEAAPRDVTLAVTFRPSLEPLLDAHPALLPGRGAAFFPTWSVPRTPALATLSRSFAAVETAESSLRGLAADALGIQLLLAVSRAVRPASDAAAEDDAPARVAAAVRYMRDHLEDDIALADIAAAAGVDPFRLLRLFRRELGTSPVRELRRLRLERAARLLRDTGISVTEACFATGHGSLSRFVTAFRREHGRPPGAWRRAQESATGAGAGKTRLRSGT